MADFINGEDKARIFYLNENENYLKSKVYKNICVPT
jgi:hypothetical protein